MGFTTGLIGGSTFTLSLLYLTLHLHTRNRLYQHALLRQQIQLLDSIGGAPLLYSSSSSSSSLRGPDWAIEARSSPHDHHLVARPSLVETLKDRWNGEVESAVRWAHGVRWDGVRDGVEGRIVDLTGRLVDNFRGGGGGGDGGAKKEKDMGK